MIRYVLLALAAAVLAKAMFGARSATLRAGRRLALVMLVVLFGVAAVSPGLVTALAVRIGVGRGADLVLYLLAASFLYLVVAIYQRFREYDVRLAKLVRHLAVEDARARYLGNGIGREPEREP